MEPCNEDHAEQDSTVGWFMDSGNGAIYGNGKYGDDIAGKIKPGQVLSIQVDTDAGTLTEVLGGRQAPWPWLH